MPTCSQQCIQQQVSSQGSQYQPVYTSTPVYQPVYTQPLITQTVAPILQQQPVQQSQSTSCISICMPSCSAPCIQQYRQYNDRMRSIQDPVRISIPQAMQRSPNCLSACQETCVSQCTAQDQPITQCTPSCAFSCGQTCRLRKRNLRTKRA